MIYSLDLKFDADSLQAAMAVKGIIEKLVGDQIVVEGPYEVAPLVQLPEEE